ncbi:hypothetical protein ACFZBE_39010 [Streptomyces sp. NPDC008061]|uniref:hypothetical protein n=1 Tax=Streptomyces sp. NPDC008061 TaxID=3364805 RepID=UPI0036E1C196
MRRSEAILVLPADQATHADVVLVASGVTEETMSCIEEVSAASANPEMRIVLVADHISKQRLARAVWHGLVTVLPRLR